jgi:hypothetical protein
MHYIVYRVLGKVKMRQILEERQVFWQMSQLIAAEIELESEETYSDYILKLHEVW